MVVVLKSASRALIKRDLGSCTCKEATSSLFPKGLLRVQGYHLVWNGLNKMNDHTQGGGVQIVKLIQFYVLLPNGCQGQVLSWGYQARPRKSRHCVQDCKQAQLYPINTRQLTTATDKGSSVPTPRMQDQQSSVINTSRQEEAEYI